jgi:hypothetical protein
MSTSETIISSLVLDFTLRFSQIGAGCVLQQQYIQLYIHEWHTGQSILIANGVHDSSSSTLELILLCNKLYATIKLLEHTQAEQEDRVYVG